MTTAKQTLEDRAAAPAVGIPLDRRVRAPTFAVRLVCWHCGAGRDILTHGPAQFGFEVAGWANDACMKAFFDAAHGRMLVFCSDEHARQQMTKSGQFRLRPKRSNAIVSGLPHKGD